MTRRTTSRRLAAVIYALDSLRTDAIRTLAPHFEHRLFLSATPHNGYPESFTALLELLDDQRFQRGVRADPKQLAAVMVRRLKSEIVDWDGTPKFPKRELIALEVPYSDGDRKAHELLREYAASRREKAEGIERFASELVLMLLKKRLFFVARSICHHSRATRAHPKRDEGDEREEAPSDRKADTWDPATDRGWP